MSYRLIPFHSEAHESADMSGEFVVASFDPGLTNFAVRVERRRPGQPPEGLLFDLVDFGGMAAMKAARENNENVVSVWGLVINYLESVLGVLARVDVFVFEKQLSPNHSVSRMSQHVMTYLMVKFRDRPPFPLMLEVDPRLKSRILKPVADELREAGTAKGKLLKKASVVLARRLLAGWGDAAGLAVLDAHRKKQDDLADAVIQIQAFADYMKK